MAKKNLKTIRELINSTNTVKGYGSDSLGRKVFGDIFAYNKTISVTTGGAAIAIGMMITGKTDFLMDSGKRRPVAAHKIGIEIKGVEQESVNAPELATRLRLINPNMNSYTDEAIIQQVLSQGTKLIPNKTVLPSEKANKMTVETLLGGKDKDKVPSDTFTIINNSISADCKVRVHCTCSSYYWTFQWYNVENEVDTTMRLPEPYRYSWTSSNKKRKGKLVTGRTQPIRNPGRAFGMCKHITLLMGMLMDEGIIDAVNTDPSNSPAVSYILNFDRFRRLNNINSTEYNNLLKKFNKDRRYMTQRRNITSKAKKGAHKNWWARNIKGKK